MANGITYPFKDGDKVIELGGGDVPQFHPNVDIRKVPNVDFVCDLSDIKPTMLADLNGTFDGVYSSYVIEHISWRKVREFIKLIARLLKPGGVAFVITANIVQQAKHVVGRDDAGQFGDNESCCLFGDQNYEGDAWRANSHACGFSPAWAIKLFREAGFESVVTMPHGELRTDMIIEARMPTTTAAEHFTTTERQEAYGHDYFNGGGKYGGYAYEGYWDYPIHEQTAQKLLATRPTSVLEIGPARGYVLKRLEDTGIRCVGLEVSKHCVLTRVTDAVRHFDVTDTPWPFQDEEFDLCFSNAVMEHIPEQYIPAIMKEIARVSVRGVHSISFEDDDDGFDKTHTTLHDKAWWEARMPYTQVVVDKEEFESGPIPEPPVDGRVKLHLGCYTTMFKAGWINMDILDLSGYAARHGFKFKQADLSQPLGFDTGSVDLIFTAHMLEHLTPQAGISLLAECLRVLKPGGILRISVPDASKIASIYARGEIRTLVDLTPQRVEKTDSQLFWDFISSGHQTCYDVDSIKRVLITAGFSPHCIFNTGFRFGSTAILRETTESLPEISLFVEARKL